MKPPTFELNMDKVLVEFQQSAASLTEAMNVSMRNLHSSGYTWVKAQDLTKKRFEFELVELYESIRDLQEEQIGA